MRLEWQILIALGLDLALGDPRWLPHPVRAIGALAQWLERPMRRLLRDPWWAGLGTALTVVTTTAGVAWGTIRLAAWLHPAAGTTAGILLIYTALAARDLAGHAMAVHAPLRRGDLKAARARVAWMVGRDTDNLDERGIARAAVESVAENTVDGVTAPLFFAVLGGPVSVLAYKAISTLDSTFGYKNERYLRFGWASARLDDVANFIPARLTLPLIVLTAALLGLRPRNAWRIARRDRRKHASPNSGLPEAAMAGALGIELGGLLHRKGQLVEMPRLGDPDQPLARVHIVRATALMIATSLLAAAVFLALRWVLLAAWRGDMS